MSSQVVIGIDIGTTNLKLVACDSDGRLLGMAQQRYPLETSAEGFITQHPEVWWQALDDCFARLRSQCALGQAVALAVSSQGETLVCCDDTGQALEPAISWMDTRGSQELELLHRSRQDWYARHGKLPNAYGTLSKILWLQRNRPEFERQVRRYCQVQDYVVARLTGHWVCDINNTSFTDYFDVWKRKWDEEVCAEFRLAGRLSRTGESGSVVGPLRAEWAKRWDLEGETLVVLGGHDQGCASLGAAPPGEHCLTLSTGTAWVLYRPMREPQSDPTRRMTMYCHAQPAMWTWLAESSGCGVLDHFVDRFCRHEQERIETDRGALYDEYLRPENLADDLIVIPWLFGATSLDNDPAARAAIIGLSSHHNPVNIFAGIAQAICFETRRNLERLAELGAAVRRTRMLGGAGRSAHWPQMVADVCDVEVEVPEQPNAGAMGAAFIAGQAAGLWTDRLPYYCPSRLLAPDAARHAQYIARFERYRRAIEADRRRRDTTGDR